MKKVILNFENRTSNFKELIQEALNRNFFNFLVSQDTFEELKKIERAILYSKNLKLPVEYLIYDDKDILKENLVNEKFFNKNIGFFIELKSKEEEKEIIELSKNIFIDFIIAFTSDWKIIPIENLIAGMHKYDTDLIVSVDTLIEAETMFKTLEIGVDGILITPKGVNDIIKLKKLLSTELHLMLNKGKVISIENIPEAERVCVDTTSLLNVGEGLLVGSTAAGFCLIHSETFNTEFVASRPFRVNAGDVSAYLLVPDDDPQKIYRTKYLSELKGGDKVLAINYRGDARIISVGRVKIETRPMLRFELEVMKDNNITKISCICQNAETVRLVGLNGEAKSVVDIKVGDEVLVHIGPMALHFGTIIRERIIEK
jgi:3-dehydroquinate synthase II